jgi:hypothetical protein
MYASKINTTEVVKKISNIFAEKSAQSTEHHLD